MAEKETSLEKIKRLTSNQKNIRNIATARTFTMASALVETQG